MLLGIHSRPAPVVILQTHFGSSEPSIVFKSAIVRLAANYDLTIESRPPLSQIDLCNSSKPNQLQLQSTCCYRLRKAKQGLLAYLLPLFMEA